MAQNPNESATIGTVTAIVGEVKATGTDGVVRILTAGDTVATGEVIETSANGAVHIQLANGRALECGPRFSGTLNPGLLDLASGTRIALDGSIINPAVAAVPAPGDIATTPATPGAIPQDIAALQAAIAGGADPSRIAEASAAGGAAPGAGGADGGGGTPLLIEQANSQGQVTSGIDGSGGQPLGFPDLTTTQQTTTDQPEGPPLTPPPPPVISVDITGIRLVPPSDPETPPEEVVVSGNIVSLVEGTSPGADPGKILNFVLVLDKASDVDIEVTYTITALGEQSDIDLVDLLGGTVTIPAGTTQILVPIKISQDHSVETDESFELVITSATNANINPDASTAVLKIINDDEPPLAQDDAYTLNEGENGTTLLASVLTRTDSGESADDSGADVGEILTVTSTGTIATTQGGQVQMNADGTFYYFAPNAEFNGTDSFSYTMTDGFNGESEAVVTITVASVNDVPNAVENAYSVNEDSVLTIALPGVLAGDTAGGDGGVLAVTSYTQPAHGSLTLDANGGFVYTPAANYNGPDSFTYSIQDADGDTDTATVAITVNPVDDAPNAADNAYSVNEDTVLTIALPGVLAGDTTGGDGGVLAVTSYTQPAHGSLTLDANGGFVYTPAANYNGPDSFTYTIEDADGDTDTATVAITVNPVDDAPNAADNAYSVNEDTVLTIALPGVLAGDTAGGDGGVLAVTSYTQPAHGSLTLDANGGFVYTPAANYNGPDSFTYTIEDADGDTDTATVAITVNPVDDAPNAADNAYSVNEDTVLTIALPGVLAGDTAGGDGGVLAVTSYTQPAHGSLTLDANGGFVYTPAANYNGPDSFTYSIQDADGDTDTATVSITVNPVDDAPNAADNAYSVNEDTVLTIALPGVLAGDTTGGDGGVLAVTSYTQPAHGSLTLDANGGFVYTPAANYNGPDSFTYSIQDADGDTDTATVSITVNPVNDPPIINVTSAAGDVYESGLPGGSAAPETESAQLFQSLSAESSTITTGSLQVGDPEGLPSVTHLNINGIDYSIAALSDGETINGSNGTLAVTYDALSGVVSYEYTLTTPAFDAPDAEEQDIFEVKVKDSSGLYSTPAAITINIQDDVPGIGAVDALLAAQTGNVVVAELNLSAGADGLQSLVVTGETNEAGQVVDVAGNVLTSNESPMTYMQSGGVLYAVTVPGDIESAVFSVTPNAASGSYSVQLLAPLDATKIVLSATFSGPDAGSPDDPYTVQFTDQAGTFVQTSHLFGLGDLEVNPSNDGLGSGANVISTGDQVGVWLGTQVSSVDIALSKFASHGNGNLTTFSWTAFNVNETAVDIANYPDVGGDADDGVYSLTEFFDSIHVSGSDLMGVVTAGDPAVVIGSAIGGGSVTAPQGAGEESDIDTYTLAPSESVLFDFVLIEQTDGSMKINGMSFESGAITEDVTINLQAAMTDGDLDPAASSFQVTFSGGGEGGYTLTGGATDEVLQGGSGNDILIGGGGVDVLTGGDGSDTFKFTDAANADIVKDFDVAGSDALDVRDLLPAAVLGSTNADTLVAYLQLVADGDGNTVVMIDADGAAGVASPTPMVTLEGVTGVSLADLLASDQLKT